MDREEVPVGQERFQDSEIFVVWPKVVTPLWTTVDFVDGDVGEGPHFVGFLQPPSDLVTNSSPDTYVNSFKVRQRNTFKIPRWVKNYKNNRVSNHACSLFMNILDLASFSGVT